jgi:hypothetical protein
MNQRRDLATAVRERERSRNRIRRLAVTVGAASLATAGIVAYNLPGPAHTTATNGTGSTPAATQPSSEDRHSDDDGEGGAITVPSGTTGQAPAHAVSGGS